MTWQTEKEKKVEEGGKGRDVEKKRAPSGSGVTEDPDSIWSVSKQT